jgi:hypothetical protein
MEQVRGAVNAWLEAAALQRTRVGQLERELTKQQYHQHRNAQARRSHTKTWRVDAAAGVQPNSPVGAETIFVRHRNRMAAGHLT